MRVGRNHNNDDNNAHVLSASDFYNTAFYPQMVIANLLLTRKKHVTIVESDGSVTEIHNPDESTEIEEFIVAHVASKHSAFIQANNCPA